MNRRFANKVFDHIDELPGVTLCGCDETGKREGFYGITAQATKTEVFLSIIDYVSDLDDVYILKMDQTTNKICILVDCRTEKERIINNIELTDIFSGVHS